MKKTKFKRRIENALDAFLADENFGENKLETFKSEANLSRERKFEHSSQKNGTLETVLKQAFLFFPGTFILYCLGMAFLPLLIGLFTTRYKVNSLFVFLLFVCSLLAATLMTWLGLGNIRKPKHFVIPASIFGVGILWITIVGVSSIVLDYFDNRLVFNVNLLIYFFPLALIVPFLAKGWVDRDS